ncbi:hypothetical protein PSU4_37780 [Pseudonocardia sulfidoxydans NBRC 16205]|uniref:Uncharacterized protein n=1 Tax=Pseudonocardia sulfidoxydans NBRC 16205 TaxID=1223511 RepID=A0A511DM07_9PSEU|nr:hypothetical protein PSU4_37780 [Pseudonocardia sulfidoxydans NBRC 16205]
MSLRAFDRLTLRDIQDAAGNAGSRHHPRLRERARHNLDRHATYAVAAYLVAETAAGEAEEQRWQ